MRKALRTVNADLHCHSAFSDGTLEPEALAARAKANGVELWALTDHDELAGQRRARDAAARARPALPHRHRDLGQLRRHDGARRRPRLRRRRRRRCAAGLAATRGGREPRAREMGEALAKVGIHDAYEGALTFAGNPELISRTHFARFLVERGVCADTQEVFRRFLVEGKPGFVPHRWARLGDAVRWISDAGGIAVIAHPARYKLTPTEDYALFVEFKAHGGRGVEVVTGAHSAADAAALCRDGARVRPARLARQRLPQPRGEPDRPRRPAAAAGRPDAGVGGARARASTQPA